MSKRARKDHIDILESPPEKRHKDVPSRSETAILSEDEPEAETQTEPARSKPTPLNHLKCCVCFDSPQICAVTPCGHLYCTDCIYRALTSQIKATKAKGVCSVCRRLVPYQKVTYLEFKLPTSKAKEPAASVEQSIAKA